MKLTLVGLPLGNIQDISLRAIETLKHADNLICEDTRVFNLLWRKLHTLNLVPEKFTGKFHVITDFNEKHRAAGLIAQLTGQEAVLVSDAGLSGFSDPGYRIVSEAIKADWQIDIVPGPTAAVSALVVSGLPPDLVVFAGFLPKKNSKIKEKIEVLNDFANQGATIIFYESPFRIAKLLERVKNVFLTAKVAIVRELTKANQEIIRGNIDQILEKLAQKPIKGECVVLVSKKLDQT